MIRFLWGKLTGNEDILSQFSIGEDDLFNRLAGKSVAIVGNARALGDTDFGTQIDQADIVIRINGAPLPNAQSHGRRTDWIAMSTPVATDIIKARAPSLILWMTSKRRRLPWALVKAYTLFLNPLSATETLIKTLGTRPTTGLMIIDTVSRSNANKIDLYGFDFFASLSLSGARTEAQVPHDFPSEKAYVDALIESDARVTLHAMT